MGSACVEPCVGEWGTGEDSCAERKFARREFMSSTLDFETGARRMTGGPLDIIFLQSQLKGDAETGQAYEVDSTSFIVQGCSDQAGQIDKGYYVESFG